MGVQLFPTLEGYDKYYFLRPSTCSVDWKSIPHKLDELDALAEQLEVASLSSFMNCTRDDFPSDDKTKDEFEQDSDLIDGVWYYQGQVLWSVEPQWFVPNQGLVAVRSLLNHLRFSQDEEVVADYDQDWNENLEQDYRGVIHELEEMEKILNRAVRENRLFRICISG